MKGKGGMHGPHTQTNWDVYVQQAFFGLIRSVACFIATEFRSMAVSSHELKGKMAVVGSKVTDQEQVNKDFDLRIRAMEIGGRKK